MTSVDCLSSSERGWPIPPAAPITVALTIFANEECDGGGEDCLVASGMELEEKQGHVRKTWRCFEPLLTSRADRAGNSTLAGGARADQWARAAPAALAQLPQRPAVSDVWRHPRPRYSLPHIHGSSVGASQHAQCAVPASGRWAGNTGAQRIHARIHTKVPIAPS